MKSQLIFTALFVAFAMLAHARAQTPPSGTIPIAIFPFALDDSSRMGLPSQYQAPSSGDAGRLRLLDHELRDILVRAGYAPVNLAPVAADARSEQLWSCNGCETSLAAKVGAKVSIIGWVQKVSNLILNINLVMRNVATGRVLRAGSVDIRGDTDESWSRGLRYLISESILPKGKGVPE